MSKRKFLELVQENLVSGWDDPRMPTIKGMRRRGYRPEGIRSFAEKVGVTKKNSVIALSTLEHAVREDLDEHSRRAMAVLRPLKVTITNYPDQQTEDLHGPIHPKYPDRGERKIPFGQTIFIEQEDFSENPPPKYQRLKPGGLVRLRYAYVLKCEEVLKDKNGQVIELKCTYDPETKAGFNPPGRPKPDGIIHWVDSRTSVVCEVRLYDRLFSDPAPDSHSEDFKKYLNPRSLEVIKEARVEPSLRGIDPEVHVQFERLGFFCTDMKDSTSERLVFNRTVTLKDTWTRT